MQSIRTVFICLGRWPSPGTDSLEAGSALRICFPYLALIIQQISLCCKAKGWNKPGCFTARFSKPKAEKLPPSPPSLPKQIAVLLVPLAAQGEVSNWLSILLPSPPRSPSEPPQVCADGQRVVPWPVGSTVAAPGTCLFCPARATWASPRGQVEDRTSGKESVLPLCWEGLLWSCLYIFLK